MIEPVIKIARAFTAQELNIEQNDDRPIQYTITLSDAYSYNIQ